MCLTEKVADGAFTLFASSQTSVCSSITGGLLNSFPCPLGFQFCRSEVGPETCISNKFPGDAVRLETTLGKLLVLGLSLTLCVAGGLVRKNMATAYRYQVHRTEA